MLLLHTLTTGKTCSMFGYMYIPFSGLEEIVWPTAGCWTEGRIKNIGWMRVRWKIYVALARPYNEGKSCNKFG